MPVTYSSSIGSGLSISSGNSDGEEPDVVQQTYTAEAAMGDLSGTGSGTAASAAIDAAAFGENTAAIVSAELSVADGGSTTATNFNADAYAAAQSIDDLANASTYVGFNYSGSGTYITVGQNSTYTSTGQYGSTSVSSTSLAATIIDIDGVGGSNDASSLPPGLGAFDAPTGASSSDDPGCGCSNGSPGDDSLNLDGNFSSFETAIFAGGENSYADLSVDAFVLQDQMSTVTIVLDAAIA